MSQPPIELKGSNFTLSVIHLYDKQPEVIRLALQDKIKQAPAFLHNAPVVLNVNKLSADADWRAIKQVIKASGLRLVGVSGCHDEEQKRKLLKAGFSLLNEGKRHRTPPVITPPLVTKSKIISSPIRSGQQIYARNCDLIVTSAVSAGAELIADGNIHIYGVMCGRALAGANGDHQSQIFCTHLRAELVSIAGEYWLSDQIPAKFLRQASRLRLQNNALTIESLN